VPKTPSNVTPIGLDRETGEIVDLAQHPKQRRRPRREIRFVLVEVENTMRHLEMTSKEWTLFWEMAARVDRENGEIRVRTAELAAALDIVPQNASRLLRRLRDRHILIEEGLSIWRINPKLLTRGSAERWAADMDDAPAIVWKAPR
jgi:hypothetical protein